MTPECVATCQLCEARGPRLSRWILIPSIPLVLLGALTALLGAGTTWLYELICAALHWVGVTMVEEAFYMCDACEAKPRPGFGAAFIELPAMFTRRGAPPNPPLDEWERSQLILTGWWWDE